MIFIQTRWLSMLAVFRRALKLRKQIEDLWEQQNRYWRRECRDAPPNSRKAKSWPAVFRDEMELSPGDWLVITMLTEAMEDLEAALLVLQGDGQYRCRKNGFEEAFGSIWDYAVGFEFLLERFEAWINIATIMPQSEHLTSLYLLSFIALGPG